MTLLKEPEFYLKDAKEFKTKLNISYELACADEFFSYLENLRALRLSGEIKPFFSRVTKSNISEIGVIDGDFKNKR